MLHEKDLYPYQRHCVEHVIENPAAGLFLEMGLGKTVSSLTAVNILKYEYFEVSKILVIAPKLVAETVWTDEVANWSHLRYLTISKVLGSEKERKRALLQDADIYIINRENVVWLVSHYGTSFPFDMLIIDELSSFKNANTARFKALRRVRPFIRRVVGLTGTPAPNSLLELWPQLYLLDQGERLGKHLTHFRDKYFQRVKKQSYDLYKQKTDLDKSLFGTGAYEKEIYDKISDICISMKSKDYLDLPETIYREVHVKLSEKEMQQYQQFERDQVLKLLDVDSEITAVNATALSTKLLQYANGAVYDEEHIFHEVHKAKLDAIEEIIDTATSPVIVCYWFQHDLERLRARLRRFKPWHIKDPGAKNKWNAGQIQVLFAHPASAGHGLNLQFGGYNLVCFSQTWSLELYQQICGRLSRPGQKHQVLINNLIAVGTMDEDVMAARTKKEIGQNALMDAVKARVRKYKRVAEMA